MNIFKNLSTALLNDAKARGDVNSVLRHTLQMFGRYKSMEITYQNGVYFINNIQMYEVLFDQGDINVTLIDVSWNIAGGIFDRNAFVYGSVSNKNKINYAADVTNAEIVGNLILSHIDKIIDARQQAESRLEERFKEWGVVR